MKPAVMDVMIALASARDKAHILVDGLERDVVEGLCEVALNVILGNIPASDDQLRSLRRFKKDLLDLTDSKTSETRAHRLLRKPGLVSSVVDIVTQ